MFRFLSRYREGRHDDGALRRCSALEKRMQMEKRFRTSHVDPITVATRGRVSPAISGNSNFKSRFRDYRAGNESVKEKRYEEMEGEREREREEQKYTVGRWLEGKHGSVTAADHSVESFCR